MTEYTSQNDCSDLAHRRDKSVTLFESIGDDERSNIRPCPYSIHDVPIHGSCNRFSNLVRDVEAIYWKVRRCFVSQMPRTSILGLKILKYRPADVV